MKRFVLVTINHKQIERAYSYSVPSELEDQVQTGSLVTVPFGKQVVQGVVLGFIDPPELHRILDILEVRTGTILSSGQLWLAQWLAKACFAPLGACISLMIPAGLSQRADVLVEATSAGVALQEKKSSATLKNDCSTCCKSAVPYVVVKSRTLFPNLAGGLP